MHIYTVIIKFLTNMIRIRMKKKLNKHKEENNDSLSQKVVLEA